MKTILVVEDEVNLNQIICDYLSHEGYRVISVHDGERALDVLQTEAVDLMILDVMLPKVDGWSVLARTRKTSAMPILMLTARDGEDDKLMGFQLGTDEYVTKPFSNKVLMARVKRMLERLTATAFSGGILRYRGITLDTAAHAVSVDARAVTMSPKLYDLLRLLMENCGQVLSREHILNKVWGYDFYGDSRVVDTHIKKLRHRLGPYGRAIQTVIKVGYKLERP